MHGVGQSFEFSGQNGGNGLRIQRKEADLAMGLFARVPQLAIALTVVVSVVGYLLLVQNSQIDRKHLSALVVEHTGVQTLKPTPVESELVAPAKSEFAEMKRAWSINPSQTGGYGKEWSGSTASGDAATQLVELLPSSTQARLVRSEAVTEYSDTNTLKAVHTSLTSRFTLPTVPGSFGASFVTTKSSTTAAASGTAIVYQVGRVVAVEDIQSSSGGVTRADATKLANAEHTLLEHSEANFSMVETSRPLLLSLIYVLASLVLIGLVLIVPRRLGRRRIRQQARRNAQARYGYRARGAKTMRRRPPAWAQPGRRARSIR